MSNLQSWLDLQINADYRSTKVLIAEKLNNNWMFESVLIDLFRTGLKSPNADLQAFVEQLENVEKIETPNTGFKHKTQYWAILDEKLLNEAQQFIHPN